MSRLMEDLLDYGRPPSLALAEADVGAIVSEATADCAGLAEAAGVAIESAVPATLPPTRVDRARLQLVLRNLIDNAIQHSPRGGRVTVIAREIRGPRHGWLECEVRDRGSGFPDGDLAHVFEPFFSRREGGTGLGLAIVERIVRDHMGEVVAENREGGGALVRIRLPVSREAGADSGAPS
jgi:signal transduction histidine kinase